MAQLRHHAEAQQNLHYMESTGKAHSTMLHACVHCCSARSVACIMAELLGRKPLFPGKDYVQQLDLITKVRARCLHVLLEPRNCI
jgi:hypothetical protein